MRIRFLGGVGTVTGSKYVIETDSARIMVDCGLFQGYKNLRMRNWTPLPVPAASIDAVILTHAHIDHSGYLPLLVRQGFSGKIHATQATIDLAAILLPDSAWLQEKDAEYANRHGISKHHPALPLYDRGDAARVLGHFSPLDFGEKQALPDGLELTFHRAGHILGAAMAEIGTPAGTILFSGDLGRPDSPIMYPPARIAHADWLVLESTYGDRVHDGKSAEDALADVIDRTARRGGSVIVPAFAVGRAQTLLFYLAHLRDAGRIPDLPVYLDSPMAIDATALYCRHARDHRLDAEETRRIFGIAHIVHEPEESKALDSDPHPKIIVSASGMATGGRVLYHLKHYVTDPRNTVLFAGYQAGGTRGAAMIGGAPQIRIHGEEFPVNAEIGMLGMLSAHADQQEIMNWTNGFTHPPRRTFIVHGEPQAADALRQRIERERGWDVTVPDYRDEAELT